MGDLELALIIITCILGSWLIFVIIGYIMIIICNKRIKNKSRTINILTAQKLDCISALCNMIVDNKGDVPDYIEDTLSSFSKDGLKKIDTKERANIKDFLTNTMNELYDIYENLQVLERRSFDNLKASVDEIDTLYRKQVILYNTDVDAYNYWIRFIPVRLFNKIFKVKKKEKII